MRDYADFDLESNSQRSESVFSRVCTGYIDSIDAENGTVSISVEDFIGVRDQIELSFDYFSSVAAGWIRFMPSIGDKVLCGFTPANKLEILRYKPISYSQMAEFAKDSNPPFIFRQLKSGEFEIVSVGYAEIWGSQSGKLHLAGGLASIDLDRESNQSTYMSSLHLFQGNGSEQAFGAIRRANPFSIAPDEYDVAPGIPFQEYRTSLIQNIGGVPIKSYDAIMGAVADYTPADPTGTFTPRMHPDTGQSLVADVNFYGPDGVQKVEFRIDQLGNVRVDLPATAQDGLRLISSLGSLIVNMFNIKLNSQGETDIVSSLTFNIESSTQVNIKAPKVVINGGVGNVLTNLTAVDPFTGNFIEPGVPTLNA